MQSNLGNHCEHRGTLGKCFEHVSSTQMLFHSYVSGNLHYIYKMTLCIEMFFSWKNTIVPHAVLPSIQHVHNTTLSCATKRVFIKEGEHTNDWGDSWA